MKKKIYVFCNTLPNDRKWYSMVAICEDGHHLAGHICSHPCFMEHDMGITSDWKHDAYDKHCGKSNWELIVIEDPVNDERLTKAYELNQKLGEKAQLAEKDKPGITIEFSD